MPNLPKVAILILNWNTSRYLKKFLPSILNTTYPNKEVFVIDNFSTDDSILMLRRDFPEVKIVEMHSNLGYATGYNLCLSKISADYFLLVNSDIEVTSSFIEPVISFMESDDSIGICQPKLLSMDTKSSFEYAGACGGWIDILGYPFARGRILLTIEEDTGQYDETTRLFWATGACMFLKSSVYQKVGGFYDYYYMHQEDIDICWRAQNAGYKIYACPEAVVYHIGGGTLSWENYLKTFLTFRNNYILLSRNMPVVRLVPTILFRILLDCAGSVYFMLIGKSGISKAIIKAVFAYFYWLIFHFNKKSPASKGWRNCFGVLHRPILVPYFFRKKRTFSEIVGSKNSN
jgi:GT2 family glycosyltransferase